MKVDTGLSGGGRRRQRSSQQDTFVEGWPEFANALLATSVMSKDNIQQLLSSSESQGIDLVNAVLSSGLIDDEGYAKVQAKLSNLDYVDLDKYAFNAAAASLLNVKIVKQYGVLPIGWKFGTPVIAVNDPNNMMLMEELKGIIGRDFQVVVSGSTKIAKYSSQLYKEDIAPILNLTGGNKMTASPDGVEDSIFGSMFIQEENDVAANNSQTPEPPKPSIPAVAHQVADTAPPPPPPPPPQPSPPPPPPQKVAKEPSNVESEPDSMTSNDLGSDFDFDDDLENYDLGSFTGGAILFEDDFEESGSSTDYAGDLDYLQDFGLDDTGDEDSIPPLANALIAAGRVTPDQMQAALESHRNSGKPLSQVLTEMGVVTEADLVRAMASEIGLEFVDLADYPIDEVTAQRIPVAISRRHRVLAIGWEGDVALVAVANPSDMVAMDDLRSILGKEFRPLVATPSQLGEYIDKIYRLDEATESAAQEAAAATAGDQQVDITNLEAANEDAPVIRFVNSVILQGLNERASDIHIEPSETDLRVRYRIDGVLHDFNRAPKAIANAVIARIKVMSEINIAEKRIPQDGRISLSAGSRKVDLRVATLPTVYGEKIVMRLLDKSNALATLEDLGFYSDVLERYESAYSKPYGMLLVTGPTGSGKSTTLYSTLNILNSPEKHIITVEDPVEYQISGINQMQVNSKAGLTFAASLRAILRGDPDIVLVGEIRDEETARIAIEAALTGHLVLSSLHTNEAASTPMRLLEMGVEPFLVTSALRSIITQRLARKLCEKCKEPYEVSDADLEAVGVRESTVALSSEKSLFKAVGCSSCSKTGYRGRISISELLIKTEEIERLIFASATTDAIQRQAEAEGMIPMRQDGFRKALDGLTTIEEVLRVVA